MANEKESVQKEPETRKIKLIKGEDSQSFWFNQPFAAEKGQSYDVKPSLAVMAIDSGKFEYVGEDVPHQETAFDALPDDFPKKEELSAAGFKTLSQVNEATDDQLLETKNFGDKSLTVVREAAAKLNEGDENNVE